MLTWQREILQRMADLNVSPAGLSRMTGIAPSQIGMLLNKGDVNPTIRTIGALAGSLGMRVRIIPEVADGRDTE